MTMPVMPEAAPRPVELWAGRECWKAEESGACMEAEEEAAAASVLHDSHGY